ncbi:isocitrate/isopropylmalate dehydrogenase [Rhodococcus opacus]|jgi:3-isopropylmalate dehydrogenase|nr:isocitrate/isopropylmalate dehydrogenase [Rhodococcus opacus]
MDLVVVRENTEGFYADRNMHVGSGEFMPTPEVAMAVGVITRRACERIAHEAFRIARSRRRSVTIAHKANVLTMTTGLFRDVCLEVAEQYPEVSVDHQHIDALAAHLVRRGDSFDVIVAENMFGDLLSDLTGELAGSIGIAPSLNSSETRAMAQAAHGAAPDTAGLGIANPIATILSSMMLLRWLSIKHDRSVCAEIASTIEDAASPGKHRVTVNRTAS